MKSIVAMLKSELEMLDYDINCINRHEQHTIDRVAKAQSQQAVADLADRAMYWGKRKHDLKAKREEIKLHILELEAIA